MDVSSTIFNPSAKVLANLDRVMEHLETGYTPPVLVEIDPSNACNQACNFCLSSYIHFDNAKGSETFSRAFMNQEMLLRLCDDLISIGTRAVNWTGGGEPTLNNYLHEAINQLAAGGVAMGMFTNGTLLVKKNLIESVVRSLSWVRISVDCGSKKTYDLIRGARDSSDWDRMVDNVHALIAEKKASQSSIDIGVGFVITPDNVHEIIPFAKYFSTFDLSYCQFKPEIIIREVGGVQRTASFWENHVVPALEEAKVILGDRFQCNEYKLFDLRLDPEKLGRSYLKCLGSQIQPCVGADGYVYVCTNHRGWKKYSYGNLAEKRFPDIWSDLVIRRQVMDRIESVEKFSNCTELCKPHESNKAMWQIYSNKEKLSSDGIKEQIDLYRAKIRHHQFI